MNLVFEEKFRPTVFALKISGAYMNRRRNFSWLCQFGATHGTFTCFFILLIYSVIFHDVKNSDLIVACSNGSVAIIYLVISYFYFFLVNNQKVLWGLRETVQRDFDVANTLPPDEQAIVLMYADKGRFVSKLWMLICIANWVIFTTLPWFLMIYYTITDEFRLIYEFPVTFPQGLEDKRETFTLYAVAEYIFIASKFQMAFLYTGMVPLGPIYILHACGQLELVKKRLQTLIPEDNYNSNETYGNLNRNVLHLLDIYDFVGRLANTFKFQYQFILNSTALLMPLTLFYILKTASKGQLSMQFILLLIGEIALTSTLCYYSDMLMEQGEGMRQAVYECGWERHWDRRTRSTILIVLIRATPPIVIETLFQQVTLEALTDVFRQAYAIFNLMNAM